MADPARLDAKLRVFARFAADLASLSTCRRLRVGCVVATPEFTEVLAVGYNGPPAGLPNDSCRGAEGACGCAHAEANAMVKLRDRRNGLVLVTTVSPCEACAGLVVNCRSVARVVYLEEYRDPAGLDLLRRAGVAAEKLDLEDEKTPREA